MLWRLYNEGSYDVSEAARHQVDQPRRSELKKLGKALEQAELVGLEQPYEGLKWFLICVLLVVVCFGLMMSMIWLPPPFQSRSQQKVIDFFDHKIRIVMTILQLH